MSKVLKFNCISSTYVDNLNILKDYSKSTNILCGYKKSLQDTNYFSSIINFSKIDIDISSIKSAFLFIYINEINASKAFPTNLCITSSQETKNISEINYKNFMENIIAKPQPVNFYSNKVSTYVRINITAIIKEVVNNDSNFNIILKTMNDYPTYYLNINSSSSKHPPYIEITLMNNDLQNSISSKTNNINIYNEILNRLEEQSNMISNITTQISNINELLKSLNDNFTAFNSEKVNIKTNASISNSVDNSKINSNIKDNLNKQNIQNNKSTLKIINKSNSSRIMLSPNKDNN